MEISFKREMKHNYLVIEGEHQENSYEVRMMAGNTIEGLMKFRLKRVDDGCCYCYEITSRQPLNRLLENKCIKAGQIRQLILQMSRTLNKMEEYLLKEDQILLEPQYIYVEPELFTVEFCLIPGREGSFPTELSKLLEYLLGKVDYQDKACVVMAYGMHRESLKDNYGMEDLLNYLVSAGEQQEEEALQGQGQEPEIKVQDKGRFHETEPEYAAGLMPEYPKPEKPHKASWRKRLRSRIEGIFCKKKIQKTVKKEMDPEDSLPWQMIFADENTSEQDRKETVSETGGPNTVLLAEREEKQYRKLLSLEAAVPDICITYYPFLIGKQNDLVDYKLDYDTVSRLHLRVDEESGMYRITDLNSTNGTQVRGVMLENNESVEVKPGDEVKVAELCFRFT